MATQRMRETPQRPWGKIQRLREPQRTWGKIQRLRERRGQIQRLRAWWPWEEKLFRLVVPAAKALA
jgi:hypothetical protein